MKVKIFLICIGFLACLALLLFIRKTSGDNHFIHHVDFYDNGSDWCGFRLDNVNLSDNGEQLFIDSSMAKLTSPAYKTLFEFNEILLCWNCFGYDSSGLAITLSVSNDNVNWYDFAYQKWGYYHENMEIEQTGKSEINGIGLVDIDVLKLAKPMRYYKFAITFYHDGREPFYLDRLSVCYTNTKADAAQFARFSPKPQQLPNIALAVPFVSQNSMPDSMANLACSPTSVTMVLNYYGRAYTGTEVAEAVYDSYSEIYGNWPYNIEAAYQLGMKKAWIGRHNSFGELADEINRGYPVVISISVDNRELTGAPYSKTPFGHLLVVRGFDDQGNVLVNDPAGDTPADGITAYDNAQLTAAWVGHGGVAYHLWPEL